MPLFITSAKRALIESAALEAFDVFFEVHSRHFVHIGVHPLLTSRSDFMPGPHHPPISSWISQLPLGRSHDSTFTLRRSRPRGGTLWKTLGFVRHDGEKRRTMALHEGRLRVDGIGRSSGWLPGRAA